nr:uncharacterized protein LOC128688708 [Cherax quadricarinatus]
MRVLAVSSRLGLALLLILQTVTAEVERCEAAAKCSRHESGSHMTHADGRREDANQTGNRRRRISRGWRQTDDRRRGRRGEGADPTLEAEERRRDGVKRMSEHDKSRGAGAERMSGDKEGSQDHRSEYKREKRLHKQNVKHREQREDQNGKKREKH